MANGKDMKHFSCLDDKTLGYTVFWVPVSRRLFGCGNSTPPYGR